jgi:hypothetical protein
MNEKTKGRKERIKKMGNKKYRRRGEVKKENSEKNGESGGSEVTCVVFRARILLE